MSRNGAWKISTCLAIGATALALGVVSTPTFAAGREGAERSVGVLGRGAAEGAARLSPTMEHANVVSVPASSFIDPTGVSSSASGGRQAPTAAAARHVIQDPVLPHPFADGTRASPMASGTGHVIQDPVLAHPFADGTRTSPAASGTGHVIQDPVLPRATADGTVAQPTAAATRRVIQDPARSQSSSGDAGGSMP